MGNTNTQPSASQVPPAPVPQQTNTEQQSAIIKPEKSKTKSKLKFILLAIFCILFLGAGLIYAYQYFFVLSKTTISSLPTPLPNSQKLITASPSPSTTQDEWRTYDCKHKGYKVSFPEKLKINRFDGDPECPENFEGGIYLLRTNTDFLVADDFQVLEKENVTINGIEAMFAKVKLKNNEKTSNGMLLYQYKRGDDYYYLKLDLDYEDPLEQLDFYKDTEWGKMNEEYNKQVNNKQSPINIEDIFHKMAQTFVLTTPEPTPVSELEVCLKTAQKNLDDNEIKISKPTGEQNTYSYTKEEFEIIYLQYQTEVNLCYRAHKEKGMKDCFELYPDDPSEEYDCNFDNIILIDY